jgi:hypothetical protein
MKRKVDPNSTVDLEVIAGLFSFLNATGTKATLPTSIQGMLIQNALSASFGQGNVLQVESLDAILKQVTFDSKSIKLWNRKGS